MSSCGAPDYYIKEEGKRSPHATLMLRHGATKVLKIDNKYPKEDAGASVRLSPGQHTIEVATQGQKVNVLGGLLGVPSQEISSQAIMQVDLAPGATYTPEANLTNAGTYFYLRDQSGMRYSKTRAYSSAY